MRIGQRMPWGRYECGKRLTAFFSVECNILT